MTTPATASANEKKPIREYSHGGEGDEERET